MTPSVIVTEVRLLQFTNTELPISVRLFGNEMFSRLVQPSKALYPILFKLWGKEILFKFKQS